MEVKPLNHLLKFLKCISDETRLKMLKLLLDQQLCICELTAILKKSQPCISQHMSRFKELDLVIEERREQWAYYTINHEVYQQYLAKLNSFAQESFSALQMNQLKKDLDYIKSNNLCREKKKNNGERKEL